MLTTLINIFWIVISIILAVCIILLVALFVLLAMYINIKEEQKQAQPTVKLTFNGVSQSDMQRTTARLLKQDKKTARKYRRPYFSKSVA